MRKNQSGTSSGASPLERFKRKNLVPSLDDEPAVTEDTPDDEGSEFDDPEDDPEFDPDEDLGQQAD